MPVKSHRYYSYYTYMAKDKLDIDEGSDYSYLRSSPCEYLEYILGVKLAAHHKEWVEAIVTGRSNKTLNKVNGKNLRISAPRGSAKTTIICGLLSWIIGNNPHIRIILCSYAEDVALTLSVAIKSIIDSAKYFVIFPKIKKSSRWRDGSWVIDRAYAGVEHPIKDPTVFAVGSSGAIASRRSDLVVLDDPIRNSKAIANPKVRAEMRRWWTEVLSPTLVPTGRSLVLSTRYRIDDIHGTNFNELKGWQVIVQKAILEVHGEEVSFWEDYMSLEFLLKKREDDPVAFASQYQNDPLSEDNQIIAPEWIIRAPVPRKFYQIAVGIDLAASEKEGSDYSAYVVCAYQEGRYYVLESGMGRWSQSAFIKKLIEVHKRFKNKCDRFSFQVESIAYQVAFINEFKRKCREEGLRVRVEGINLKGDKAARLYGISGLFEDSFIIFDETIAFSKLVEQVINFGCTAHDDLQDGMVYGISKLYKVCGKLESGKY